MFSHSPKYLFLTLFSFLCFFTANGQLTAAQNYARNRPGVLMVKTHFSANIYVKQVKIDNRLLDNLLDSISRIDAIAPLSPENKLDIVLDQFSKRPSVYFSNTADYRRHLQNITIAGTGFFITEEGHIVTNCHVVDESDDHIRKKFTLSAFRRVTETNIDALQKAWAVNFSDAQRELLYNTFAKIYSSIQSILIENMVKKIYVQYGIDTATEQIGMRTQDAEIIVKGRSMPGKDVAILKISSNESFPTLKLSDQLLPRIGDRVFVFGYPDPIFRNEYLARESTFDPSLTTGVISGIRRTTLGWNVVQMDAEINHGNSGGPVCDENGEVIGIATFGSIEYSSGVLAPGMNFSIPVQVLKEFIEIANLKPGEGKLSKIYTDAMEDYDHHQYRAALKKLSRLRKLSPVFPGLSYYINDIEHKIDQGMDRSEQRLKLWALVVGLLVLMIALIIFRKFLMRNQKSPQSSVYMDS